MKKDKNKTLDKTQKYKLAIVIVIIILIIGLIVSDRLSSKSNDEASSFIVIDETNDFDNKVLSSYSDYQELMTSLSEEANLVEDANKDEEIKLTPKDFRKNKYLALFLRENECSEKIKKVTVKENKLKKITVQVNVDLLCGFCTAITKLYFIPIDKKTDINAEIDIELKKKRVEKCHEHTIDKPIIYLYPETTQEIEVKLGKKENIIRSYPEYQDGWKVIAEPSGKLTDLHTNKNFYSLYWEGRLENTKNYSDGFVVKKEDLASFFEEKLSTLGLSYKEQEEFIIYWLPELDSNDYTFIRFMTKEEINEEMPLEVTPTPKNIIRVWMQYKKVDSTYQVPEQTLASPSREGYTLVEWGGTEIK